MKSESYNALASLNRGFDLTLESLKALQQEGVVNEQFVSDNSTFIQRLWSDINWMIVHRLSAREMEDRHHFGILQDTTEKRRKHEATASPGGSGEHAVGEIQQRSENRAEPAGKRPRRNKGGNEPG